MLSARFLRNTVSASGLIACSVSSALAQQSAPLMATCQVFKKIDVISRPDGFTLEEAVALSDEILTAVGLVRNFEVVASANTANAAAVIVRDTGSTAIGKRLIIYNPEWIASELLETRWTVIGLLAHEIGHHLQGHTLDCTGSVPSKELEADRFAGFILGRLGASQSDATALWRQPPFSEVGSDTHPARSDRLVAVLDGWKNGSET